MAADFSAAISLDLHGIVNGWRASSCVNPVTFFQGSIFSSFSSLMRISTFCFRLAR